MDHPDFGGISGFDYTNDGSSFLAVTDRGRLIAGEIIRNQGKPVGVTSTAPMEMRVRAGQITRPRGPDAEGVAIGRDGSVFVSFEGVHVVRQRVSPERFDPLAPLEHLHPFIRNGSLEALAIGSDGSLYTLVERSGAITKPIPLFRHSENSWAQFGTIDRRDGFLPVGADIGPDGRFYLLERAFIGFGFRSRLRRFEISSGSLANEKLLFTTRLGRHGNLEAIAVWRHNDDLRATMVSDDNFLPTQSTVVVEYMLPD